METTLLPELLGMRHEEIMREDARSNKSRSLILQFDSSGNANLIEMTRTDVLTIVLQAASEVPNFPPENQNGFCDVQNIHMRDLRKLDAAFAVSNEPSIMVRKQAILINADPIRAVILRNTCLIFVPDGADSLLYELKQQFMEFCQDGSNTPFEFRAIEAIFATLCRIMVQEFDRFQPIISSALERLLNVHMTFGELETLRTLKNTVNEYDSQVSGIRRALMDILDNEEDLRLLHLTKLYHDPSLVNRLDTFDSEDAEVMLEVYLQDIHSTRTKVGLMQHRIQNTESLLMLKLDGVRNYLLSADVIFGLISMCFTFGMFVTGAFGMNLRSGLEGDGNDPQQGTLFIFWGVFAGTGALTVCGTLLGIRYFKSRGVMLY